MRERLFMVATKKPNGFQFPEPTHDKPGNSGSLFALPSYVTVGDALAGLGKPIVKKAGMSPLNEIENESMAFQRVSIWHHKHIYPRSRFAD